MKQGKSYFTVILWILLAAIAAYFGYHVISSLYAPLMTATVTPYEAGAGYYASGFVVREEELLYSQYGTTVLSCAEGAHVAANDTVATGYRSEDARLRQTRMDELSGQIEQLQYAWSAVSSVYDQAALDADIADALAQLSRYLALRDMNSVSDLSPELKGLILRRTGSGADSGALQSRISALQAELERFIDGEPAALPWATEGKIGKTIDFYSGRNRYIGYLISLGIYSFKGMRVGLDCANGSSWNIAKSVFDALGAKTYVINAQPDGFNINNNAGSTHIEGLQRFVIENGLDVGFAYDGDADRCLCVDEKGEVITGDHILYICGKVMKEQGLLMGNTVVTTVMSNFGLYKAFDECGINYEKTKVGDKYVYENMMMNNYRLGGEQSGHIIFSRYASTGDGILTSLKVMEAMLAKKKTLSQLCEGFTFYPQVLKNIRVDDKAAAQNDPAVQKAIADVAAQLGSTGRILVRESGTEPVVRVMVEAESKVVCQDLVDSVIEVIKKTGHAV